ncbi:helix-turn-helix domain-containing protein [Candidatus Kaiserbacteria bacterium]|nr:helix-turn-helix domain-containing protein [Candidatus Kaiserbacteria bacterium]
MTNKQFGANLVHIRQKRGLTQVNLAKKSGLHRSFISGVEKGERNITLETIAKLGHALEISSAELFASDIHGLGNRNTPTDVTFLKIGGTWDMIATKEGLRGTGSIDDDALAKIEASSKSEDRVRERLEMEFAQTKSIQKDLASHFFWVTDIDKLIGGEFYPIFSADGSNFRPSIFSAVIAHLLKTVADSPLRQVIAGVGTDTTDMLMPFLDVFLFDQTALPILVSGANRSHRETHSDAPQNFHDLAFATHLPLMPGAYYIFNKTIYRGGDLIKVDPKEEPSTLEGMITFFAPQRTQTRIGYLQAQTRNPGSSRKLVTYSSKKIFDAMNSIVTIDLGDNNPIEHEVAKILDPRFPSVIVKSHALGNAPNPIRNAVKAAILKGKSVMNVSRCLMGETDDRYYVSLSNLNKRELAKSSKKVLEGGKLNHMTAKAILTRALLEKRSQKETQELIDAYSKRTF